MRVGQGHISELSKWEWEAMPDSFAHLHVHTEYSLLDGAARIEEIVAALNAPEATISSDKISLLKEAKECVDRWRVNGGKIAFTNGT